MRWLIFELISLFLLLDYRLLYSYRFSYVKSGIECRQKYVSFILKCNNNNNYNESDLYNQNYELIPKFLNNKINFMNPMTFSIFGAILTDTIVSKSKANGINLMSQLKLFTNQPSKPIYSGAIGYEAASSAFSPGQSLKTVPLLPQSALLNSLPIKDELIGQLQAYFESFVQLINPSAAQVLQISKNESVLWNNLRVNAQRAAGIFLYNRKDLLPKSKNLSPDLQIKLSYYTDLYLNRLQVDSLRLVNASRKSSVSESLRCMRKCLDGLCDIAYLLSDPLSNISNELPNQVFNTGDGQIFYPNRGRPILTEFDNLSIYEFNYLYNSLKKVPKLIGRAKVILKFQRPGPSTIIPINRNDGFLDKVIRNIESMTTQEEENAVVTILVDGINHPYTGGNFIDLCLKNFYVDLPVRVDSFEEFGFILNNSSRSSNRRTRRAVFGDYTDGYVDPLTNIQRRVPLEVYRENLGLRYTIYGTRNSALFSPGKPVNSFATYGAIGMYHDKGDNNGASSSFFWIPADQTVTVSQRNSTQLFTQLNNQYSLFAYAIEGNDVLENLQLGDVLISAQVVDGFWLLLRSDENNIIGYDL